LKISFFVHDLAANPLARAIPLAQAIASDVEVEILGFLLSGDAVYAPYRGLVRYHAVRASRDVHRTLAAIPSLANRATGDIIYACKPLVTTLGPALWASGLGRSKPLILDVEDDEWVPMGASRAAFIRRDLIGGWRHATAWKYTRLLHPLTKCAAGVTVVSSTLQQRYGGTRVIHGPDERVFDPDRSDLDRGEGRMTFGLPAAPPIVLFSGTPQPHKGFDVLLSTLERRDVSSWHLALAGKRCEEFADAERRLNGRCHVLGEVSYSDQPLLLTAASAVAVPQRRVPFAEAQISAKALDALAMRCPLIAARVGDLPAILGDGDRDEVRRGWVIDPGDVDGLAGALRDIETNPVERDRRTRAGRDWFVREAGASAIRARLLPLFERVLGQREPVVSTVAARH
jgi:glycosyltransferase involved in cell wall biosynthesis